MSTPAQSPWAIDAAAGTATHVSGLVLVARKTAPNQYQVQPRMSTLPVPAVQLSAAEREILNLSITRRVEEGGALLVQALASPPAAGIPHDVSGGDTVRES